jgi:hypothetical protein
MVAAFTLAINDLFVGKHSAQRRTPVDWHLCLVGKPLLEQLQEDPLRPPVKKNNTKIHMNNKASHFRV